jgi:hypothetical protein
MVISQQLGDKLLGTTSSRFIPPGPRHIHRNLKNLDSGLDVEIEGGVAGPFE